METTGITIRRANCIQFGVLLLIALAALLCPLGNDYRALWLSKLQDVAHVPLFFAVTLGLYRSLGNRLPTAMCGGIVLAAIGELGQTLTGRSPSLGDFLRGVLGMLMAAMVVAAGRSHRRLQSWVAAALGLAVLVAWPVSDCAPVLLDAAVAYRSFPTLASFRSAWEPHRWRADSAKLELVRCGNRMDDSAGRITFFPHEGGTCGMILFPIVRDWSAYRRLKCELSFQGQPLSLLLSIRDGQNVKPPQRRFELRERLASGRHCISIDLGELASGGQYAPLDLSRIQSFHICAERLSVPREILLKRVYLE